MLRATAACLVSLLVLTMVSSAEARRVERSARLGVRAYLSYGRTTNTYGGTEYSGFKLKIFRRGRLRVNTDIGPLCTDCIVEPGGDRRSSIRVRDLRRDREPEILVDLYSGGAHCCFYSRIFVWNAARHHYRRLKEFWGNEGYRLQDLSHDGRLEFVTADDRFNYAFACFACSGVPIKIVSIKGLRLRNVTRRHPRAITRDARRWLGYYRSAVRHRGEARGVFGAYIADVFLLHRRSYARTRIRQGLARGYFAPQPFSFPPKAAGAYIRLLGRDLGRWGYG